MNKKRFFIIASKINISILIFVGCAGTTINSRRNSKENISFEDSQIRAKLLEQKMLIEDLTNRLTKLENIVLKQSYQLEYLKKWGKGFEKAGEKITENIDSHGEKQQNQGENAGFEGKTADYSIFISTGEEQPYDNLSMKFDSKKINDCKNNNECENFKSAVAGNESKGADISSLIEQASLISNYVPLKIPPAESTKLVSGQISGNASEKKDTLDPYLTGIEKYKEGKWSDAVLYFDIFLRDFPDESRIPTALFLKGEALFQSGKFLESMSTFETILVKYPGFKRSAEASLRIARCYEKIGDKGGAVKAYEVVVQNFPKSDSALKALKKLKELKGEKNSSY